MAFTETQRKAADYLRKKLTKDGVRFEEGAGSKNITLYFNNRNDRYVIQPNSTRDEHAYVIPASEYSKAEKQWARVTSYSTSAIAKLRLK